MRADPDPVARYGLCQATLIVLRQHAARVSMIRTPRGWDPAAEHPRARRRFARVPRPEWDG
jgi:hypothetical protein